MIIIILAVLGCMVAIFASIIQWIKERRNNERHHNYTLIFVTLGTILATVNSIVQYHDSQESESDLKRAYKQIDKLQHVELDSTKKILAINNVLVDLNLKLTLAQEKIIELQQQNLEEIKGGNNKPLFGWGMSGGGFKNANGNYEYKQELRFYIVNYGNHHIRNINVSVRDPDNGNLSNAEYIPYNAKEQRFYINDLINFRNFEIKSLSPMNRKTFYAVSPKDSVSERKSNYQIAVEWDNGYYYVDFDLTLKNTDIISSKLEYYDASGKKLNPEKFFKWPKKMR